MSEAQGLTNFDLSKLAEIDGGRIALCFKQQLRRCVGDIDDRPGDDRDREIIIKLTLKPDAAPDGLLDGVKMKCQVSGKVPSYRSKVYDFGQRNGNLVYQPMSPTDHNGTPLPGFDEAEEQEGVDY